ncbi:bifunctional phosphopantothenoylcysteine decarboxylase/phosphopantothenate--cysteine ligase CoaBC [Pseudoflavitalea sp. G-6-1-2]|uniref:bifunctional phosphopantothenoylcysteine decarboxylase/phosphopantothenate--cysteine ligase CoaBC n=1 Tax=Pseudoflavitalea sp. G-6-1-2 TaxID=2728841 RepID=UPI00146E0389|nr:bifunctional phosphopantothenoylcysteine decarboxylase/phosphopantothenate--cysteine ligase CoaBC [Pseudoflavitalea sp. G-6-1-2]NML22661.1 bifunctional phosphopantothenoylcysteine decarboxylase/phosphopantothenate--cysteine ligase CoaBC [Pseudoflavitalea sp. G-6-1-2]
MFQGKKILLAITGSIAAYKSILIVRLLVKAGAEVRVVLTPSAKDFVTPLTLSTLSKNPVVSELFNEQAWSNHVMLGRWADVMLVAPLSCNTLAKMAAGQCDNMVLATYLSATCPVVVAPAMDEDMWHHPTTRENLAKLESFGNKVIPVDKGELASGLNGDGRMAEPEAILQYLQDHLFQTRDLEGKIALVTAGPTYEPLDPVRFIGNHSSGKMGIAIAEELARRGAQVELVLGPSSYHTQAKGIHIQRVQTAEEMYQACTGIWPTASLAVMSAAVADYSPTTKAKEKIKKTEESFTLELTRTKDILGSLGKEKQNGQLLVGFALETTNEKDYAQQKLKKKNADIIVLNSLNDEGAGFGYDTNKITIFEKDGNEIPFNRKPKQEVARDIVDRIVNMLYA